MNLKGDVITTSSQMVQTAGSPQMVLVPLTSWMPRWVRAAKTMNVECAAVWNRQGQVEASSCVSMILCILCTAFLLVW